jgi:leucyl-tRNA synthetase
MIAQFKTQETYKVDAPEDYSMMTHEEKNKGKYFATFPYPYMNGYLHLGKLSFDVLMREDRSRLHYGQG